MARNKRSWIRDTHISHMHCPECGGVVPIPRSRFGEREKGHIKDMWCPFCKKEVKMKEVRSVDHIPMAC